MAGIRDDSAGNYGQWDSSDLSWLDFIKATGSDVGNGAYNALSNITGALSPIGTSPEGNMSLQVPPMITGIADSYRRLSDPTGPGNAYRLTGVPELDAPIQKDMSDVLLSFTGGQAIGGLGRAALPKRGMNRIERTVTDYDFPMYRMTDNAGTEIARAQFDELPNAVRVKDLFVDPSHRGQGVASTLYGHIQDDLVKPMTPDYTLTPDGFEFWKNSYPEAVADYRFDGQTYRQPGPLRAGAETGAVESYRMSGGPNRDSNVLWSDTGKPSIFGSALATAGEQPKGITAYHGSPHDFDKFSLDKIGTGEGAQAYGHGLYFADAEDVAHSYKTNLANAKRDTAADDATLKAAGLTDYQIEQARPFIADTADIQSGFKSFLNWTGVSETPELKAAFADVINRRPTGKMYQVRINADPESFLDWDKPLSQQSEAVQNLYNQRVAPGIKTREIGENPNLGMLYDVLHPEGGSIGVFPKEKLDDVLAAPARYVPTKGEDFARGQERMLREAGIPGIRYLDGNSRADGQGSSNYVVFDDSLIEILKKYGMAGGALGAGAMAQPDSAAAQDIPDWLKF